jgi:long-chain acyl-CoA synthetase
MPSNTLSSYVDQNRSENPDHVWLRDRRGDEFSDWTFGDAAAEIDAAACWLESRDVPGPSNIAILSRNRAHWVMADLAIIRSGNVTIPLFTTLNESTAKYILEFSETTVLILGESENWAKVREILPESVEVVTLPGVSIDDPHVTWEDAVSSHRGNKPRHKVKASDLISLVFTSGTTGVPKGVMQDHDSFVRPMQRAREFFCIRDKARFLSYLPMSHIAERQLIMVQSLIYSATITFNESLATLRRDMADTRPNFLFGAPRVWEQLQQGILAKFGSQKDLDEALAAGGDAVGLKVRQSLGLDDVDYLLTAAAPTPPALIRWYETLGLIVMEGFGQTEIMATAVNSLKHRRIGSIGRVLGEVEIRITDEGEILFKAPGPAIGYYKMPEKTAETFVDGWVHTGDKGYIDDDGYVFLTGRVKDYFKTIQGKFVAPAPIESEFSAHRWTEQVCLLGRGYSKTVIVCVLTEIGQQQSKESVEESLLKQLSDINKIVEKHARLGAIIISVDPWTIENDMLTPTLKIRRDEVEARFGEQAQQLAHDAATNRKISVAWL